LNSTISVEADMKHQFSTDIIHAAVIITVAVAIGSACLIPGKFGDSNAVGIAGTRGATGPLVLAQYNPCPNGRCR
jgi:2-methylaconitate cis-trans-isomerase PrpF